MKKILVIGNGGREHAICKALEASPQEVIIYNFGTAVNPGIKDIATEIFVGDIMDNEEIKKVAKDINPDFAIVGPDDPIGNGAADALEEIGILSFAPTKKCAQLESSKSFTRNLLKTHNIEASPEFFVSTDIEDKNRAEFFAKFDGQIVVKADGLLGGKGVIVADDHFQTFEEAEEFAKQSIEKFGRVVLEEKMVGPEFSIIYIVDGHSIVETPAIQDHKRAFVNDEGPNTGGMGTVSDENNSLPFLTDEDKNAADKITYDTMKAVEAETGERYVGVMYGGFMKTKNGVKLIEYNSRFGDPEVFNILSILKTDFVEVCEKSIAGKLADIKTLDFENVATVVKYLCPEGYPTNSVKNKPVTIHASAGTMDKKSADFFVASIGEEDGQYLLKGSRAIACIGKGKNWEEANDNCEAMIQNFHGPLFYREDIGTAEYWDAKMNRFSDL